MTLQQFNNLNEKDKVLAIVDQGVCLGRRSKTHHDFELRQIDGFYVEIKYLKGDDVNMLSFKTFSSLDLLGVYVDQVDISDIRC